jgi:hypothetical protein
MMVSHTFELENKYLLSNIFSTKIIAGYEIEPEYDREDGLTYKTTLKSVTIEIGRDVVAEDMPINELCLDLKDFIVEKSKNFDLSDFDITEEDLMEEAMDGIHEDRLRREVRAIR